MSTVMNFVCVLGAILIFFLSALGAVVLYDFIKHHDEIQEKKDSRSGSIYQNYSSYADHVNQVIPNTTPYELRNISSRISELEDEMEDIRTILEVGDHGDFICNFTTTIPEDIQNLRDDVAALNNLRDDVAALNNRVSEQRFNENLENLKKQVNESIFNIKQTAQKAVDNSELSRNVISSYREYFLDFSARLENLEAKQEEPHDAKIDA